MTTIGFYAHHVGRGHLDRIAAVSCHLSSVDVTVASSHPDLVDLRAAGCRVWALPGDECPEPLIDRSARGRLHHAPLRSARAAPRMASLLDWIEHDAPDLVMVDVSTEVLLTLRLAAVPVVAVRLHGERDDPAHRLGFDVAESIVAPFPRLLEHPDTPAEVVARSFHTGLIWPPSPTRPSPPVRREQDEPRVLVAWGRGCEPPSGPDLDRAAEASPGWRWSFAGPPPPTRRPQVVTDLGWVRDLRSHIRAAAIVIGPCGDGLLGAVAAEEGRLVAIPQDRPFDEQRHKASALGRCGLAEVVEEWPPPQRWPEILAKATAGPALDAETVGPDGAPGLARHLLHLVSDAR